MFIAHDLSVVRHVSDRVAVMYLGRIAELGQARSVYDNARHPYTSALLSAASVADPDQAARAAADRPVGDVPSPIDPPSGCRFHPRCPKAQELCIDRRARARGETRRSGHPPDRLPFPGRARRGSRPGRSRAPRAGRAHARLRQGRRIGHEPYRCPVEATTVEEAPAGAIEGRSPWQLAWGRLRSGPGGGRLRRWSSCCYASSRLVAPLLAAIIGHQPAITCTERHERSGTAGRAQRARFLLGTDNLGRDMLVRVVYGARVSLLVGLCSTAIATVVGVVVGLLAGYYGGVIDTVLARFMDVVLAFPYLLLALALVTVFGPSLPMVIGVIAFFSLAAMARIVRGQTLSIKEKEYIEAARSIGASPLRIMFVDMLPNLIAPVLVLATLLIPTAIVFESTLSYLGLGIQPPTPSWGNMLADSQQFYQVAWWFLIFPAAALLITTLAFNLLGDGVRDAIDPGTERIFAARRRKRELPVEGPPLVEPPRPVDGRGVIGDGLPEIHHPPGPLRHRRALAGHPRHVLAVLRHTQQSGGRRSQERAARRRKWHRSRHRLGLDQPVIVQYWHYLDRLLHGDLGTSFYTGAPVNGTDQGRPAGHPVADHRRCRAVADRGHRRGRAERHPGAEPARPVRTLFVLIGISMPTFVVGLLLLFVVYFQLAKQESRTSRQPYVPFTENPAQWFEHMILPWITLALVQAATYSRLTRGSLLDTLGEDYIRTARAKGLRERRVIYRHGLRAALTPVVTQLGIDIGTLIGGAVVTESVFDLGGVGQASAAGV